MGNSKWRIKLLMDQIQFLKHEPINVEIGNYGIITYCKPEEVGPFTKRLVSLIKLVMKRQFEPIPWTPLPTLPLNTRESLEYNPGKVWKNAN